MIDINHVRLIDFIPPNLREDIQVRAAAESFDLQMQKLNDLAPRLALLYNIDSLDERWVDELAWQEHVDFYEPSLPLEQKRELVKNAKPWHRRKGTPSAVRELIDTVFGSGEVLEWWEYGGERGYFRVTTSDPDATTERAREFLEAIESAKNTRSWLESIQITTEGIMDLYFGNALHMGEYMTVEQVV